MDPDYKADLIFLIGDIAFPFGIQNHNLYNPNLNNNMISKLPTQKT